MGHGVARDASPLEAGKRLVHEYQLPLHLFLTFYLTEHLQPLAE